MIKLTELEESFETKEDLFYYWLVNGKVDFNKLLIKYVCYLENVQRSYENQLSEADYPLLNTIKPTKGGYLSKQNNLDAIYRYLVKYERFKGAPVWDELVEYVKKNKINLDGSYFLDLYLEENKNER